MYSAGDLANTGPFLPAALESRYPKGKQELDEQFGE